MAGRELSKTPRPEHDPGKAFVERSRSLLSGDFLPRIRGALAQMSEADVWWRPNPSSNAVGNLLLHLAGNARQWIVSGVGGEPDLRERQTEFDARGGGEGEGAAGAAAGPTGAEALARLEDALADVDRVLAGLDPARLGERLLIQGHDVSVLDAIYHVVEHVSMHTGQILYVAKLRTGRDLGFWKIHEDGTAEPRW